MALRNSPNSPNIDPSQPRCITGAVIGNKSDADAYDADGGWDYDIDTSATDEPTPFDSDKLDRKSLLFFGLLIFGAGIALGILLSTGNLGENRVTQIPPPVIFTPEQIVPENGQLETK